MESFLQELANILEVDKVEPGDVLVDFEDWDSLSVLSAIAMIDGKYHVSVSAGEINRAVTAQALFDVVQKKIAK
jgi:acyl carrier protein